MSASRTVFKPEKKRIVITHGTDTMTETAAAIADAVTGKTVVLSRRDDSLRLPVAPTAFSTSAALSPSCRGPPEVHIAMNGKCFPWDRVCKNRERGEFEEISAT